MNNRNKILSLLLGLACLSITSCDLGEEDFKPINGGINFTIAEYHPYANTIPISAIGFNTNEEYSCSSFLYQYLETTATSITITFRGYQKNTSCSSKSTPATALYEVYQENGIYDLIIKYEEIEDQYKLTITDSTLAITQDESFAFSKPNNTLYWKYPPNSFALFAGTQFGTDSLYTQFFDSLEQKYDFSEFSFPDSGLTPFTDSLSGFDVSHQTRFFKYEDLQEVYSAGTFIRDFGINHIPDRSKNRFILLNWTNVLFSSSDL